MFSLRYYQEEAADAVRATWERHQAAAVIAATGTGKTELFLSLAISEPGRVLIVAHRDYLLGQPISRLAKQGFTDVAIEKADQKSEGMFQKAKVVFASVQSLSRPSRLATFDPQSFSVVIIDEGHRAVAATYRRIIDHFRRNPRVRILILTATPKRKDNLALGNLCDGDIDVAYCYGPLRASHEGWIVPLRFYRREVEGLDFSRVNLKGADLDQDQVQALLMEEEPLHKVCASLADDRGPTIVFCPGVDVARAYTILMNQRYRPGRAVAVWQETPEEERAVIGEQLAQGDLDYAFNCDIFSEGYDVPELVRVVWAAPTASLVRFTQGTGRVFRPHGSLKGQLAGGVDDAPARRLLIEQSPKPFGQVVTYYPQNCKHQLCEPNDILGGDELAPAVRAAAKQIQEATAAQPGGSNPEEDVDSAQALVELRALLEERRKKLKAKATVTDTEYDAFGGSRNRAPKESAKDVRQAAQKAAADWPEGDGASDKQIRWLQWKGVKNAHELGLTKFRACCVRELMERGVSAETALGYGKKQALAVRRSLESKQKDAG